MSIALCGLRLGMAQELAYDWQSLVEACAEAREGVPQIVKPKVMDSSFLSNPTPRFLEIYQVLAVFSADNDEGVVRHFT
jgi:hypothetical protein